ncbi:hypothetical protein GCM10027169_16050 [Gordonia jinhuaensis]|uniref:Glutamate decarboxylase n=1 Tax=Gordonia jinhuaensis TaxID=1517702 RepID=A0A916X214_9ACTN|nr:hypothetical protein GCM10011489_39700 [Gordonia jinhuaensis]
MFCWRIKHGHTANWDLYDLADRLRMKGWLVPAYPMADDLSSMNVQRIVVRSGLSKDLATSLLADIKSAVHFLDSLDAPVPKEHKKAGFHH